MNLNQVTIPSINVEAAVTFYQRLGLVQIVEGLPDYARFECPTGQATFSIHRVDRLPAQLGVVVYFECDDLDATVQKLKQAGIETVSIRLGDYSVMFSSQSTQPLAALNGDCRGDRFLGCP